MQRILRGLAIFMAVLGGFVSTASADPAARAVYRDASGKWVLYTPPIRVGPRAVETYGPFSVTFLDVEKSTGISFDDPVEGPARRATFGAVCVFLGAALQVAGTADIEVQESVEVGGFNWLAGATTIFDRTADHGCHNGYVFKHLTTGVDPEVDVPDGIVEIDFGHNWNSGVGAPAVNQYDLFGVMLHEMTHALGFLSLTDEKGEGAEWCGPGHPS